MEADKAVSGKDKLQSFLNKHKTPDNGSENIGAAKAAPATVQQSPKIIVEPLKEGESTATRARDLFSALQVDMQNSPYRALYCLGIVRGFFTGEGEAIPQVFLGENESLTSEKQSFLKSLDTAAMSRLKQTPQCCGEELAVDATLHLQISNDLLRAWAVVLPSIGSGKTLSEQNIKEQIRLFQISYGVDLTPLLNSLNKGKWIQLITIARGKKGEDGKHGLVSERFSREKKISYATDNTTAVDYKNLNWVQKVEEDDIICDLVQPTEAVDGMAVTGVTIKKKPGDMPVIPAGSNTKISDDKTALVAACRGQLSFYKNAFNVDQGLRIRDDVDTSVGNLDIYGDLEIDGNVGEGFTLKATGNITIKGLAEGAFLKAGGEITVKSGIKGNSKGSVIAKGGIYCKYIENATVRAGKNVTADYIVNSMISAKDSVSVLKGHGAIIGGKIYAVNKIEAKSIGNESNRNTELVIGADAETREVYIKAKKDLEEKNKVIAENELNVKYIEKSHSKEPEYKELLSRIKLKITVDRISVAKLEKQIVACEELMSREDGQVIADVLYPQVSIEMNGVKTTLHITERMRRIYKENGEITMGSK